MCVKIYVCYSVNFKNLFDFSLYRSVADAIEVRRRTVKDWRCPRWVWERPACRPPQCWTRGHYVYEVWLPWMVSGGICSGVRTGKRTDDSWRESWLGSWNWTAKDGVSTSRMRNHWPVPRGSPGNSFQRLRFPQHLEGHLSRSQHQNLRQLYKKQKCPVQRTTKRKRE